MTYTATTTNPFSAARLSRSASSNPSPARRPVYARLPLAPINASPVPELTSLYHNAEAGKYGDRDAGFVPLAFYTKLLAFRIGLRQCSTCIIRFSHGASSGRKVYRSSFIPGLHDVCMVFEKRK